MNADNKSINFFNHQHSGCYWYRIKRPMDTLRNCGIPVDIVDIGKDVDLDKSQTFQLYGAYPMSFEKTLEFLKEKGMKIVYDSDDALDLVDEQNPFYYAVKKDAWSVQEILNHTDELTVSTPQMAEYFKGKTKAKITVIPNVYDPKDWTFKRPEREGIRIGFAGSSTHVADLINIIPTIKKLQDKYNVKFLIMGFGKEDYRTWFKQFRYVSAPEGIKLLEQLDKLMSEIVFEWIPFVDFELYPQVLTNMALDIGICPLQPTPFNNHRSACKAMEYTLSGALALASDTIPYREDQSSILVKDNEWEEALTHFIENPENRKAEHAVCLDWIKENRNCESESYKNLIKSIYTK